MQSSSFLTDDGWSSFLRVLPQDMDLDGLARQTRALRRRRGLLVRQAVDRPFADGRVDACLLIEGEQVLEGSGVIRRHHGPKGSPEVYAKALWSAQAGAIVSEALRDAHRNCQGGRFMKDQ